MQAFYHLFRVFYAKLFHLFRFSWRKYTTYSLTALCRLLPRQFSYLISFKRLLLRNLRVLVEQQKKSNHQLVVVLFFVLIYGLDPTYRGPRKF